MVLRVHENGRKRPSMRGWMVNESVDDEFTRVKLWKQTSEDFPKNPFSRTRDNSGAEQKLNWIMNNKCFQYIRLGVCSIIITLSYLNIKMETEALEMGGKSMRC
jgi:hypothetical protein